MAACTDVYGAAGQSAWSSSTASVAAWAAGAHSAAATMVAMIPCRASNMALPRSPRGAREARRRGRLMRRFSVQVLARRRGRPRLLGERGDGQRAAGGLAEDLGSLVRRARVEL